VIAANKWYQYQQQYGEAVFQPYERVTRAREKARVRVTSKDRLVLIVLTIMAGLIGIGLVISSAFSASIKYDINTLIKENAVIQGEIENLNVEIKAASNIGAIEERALSELGLVYPDYTQFRYLEEIKEEDYSLASIIKDRAYN